MELKAILQAAHKAFSTDHLDDALVLLRAIEDVPSPRLWSLRADLHRERCEPQQAAAALERGLALGLGDGARLRKALLWNPIMESKEDVSKEWDRLRAGLMGLEGGALTISDPVAELPWLDFYLAYRGGADRSLRESLARILRKACPDLIFEADHVSEPRRPGGPIRIGFCSSHLRDHTIGRLNEGVIRGVGAHGMHVVLAVPEASESPLFRALAAAVDEVVVLGRERVEARRRLAAAELDVLHYPDLGMDLAMYWLAHARLAPVQTMSWGHPITSGLPTIDAFLASESLVPSGTEDQFSETVLRLGDPMICWSPPPPPPPRARGSLGLPEGPRIYLVPQTAFKLHPDFDTVLAGILERDPQGVLALLAPTRAGWKRKIEDRLDGVVPLDRLVWVGRQPREGFLALLRAADVILDPFPFAGGHTSLEAFAMGTPIITLPTHQLRGRITAAWYRAMGLDDLICADLEDYVARAVAWAADPAPIGQRIASATGALFDHAPTIAAHAGVWKNLLAQASCARSVA